MLYELRMPRIDDDMLEGTVHRWFKREGDLLKKGDPVVEIETQKVNYEIEAPGDGLLRLILIKEEAIVPINTILGVLADAAEDLSRYRTPGPEGAKKEGPSQTEAPAGKEASPPPPRGARLLVTPIARKLAEERGLDLAEIPGTGPDGRITKEDVLAYRPPAKEAGKGGRQVRETLAVSGLRKVIADRMLESWKSCPRAEHFISADVTDLVGLRNARRESWEKKYQVHPSINDFIIAAAVRALKAFPKMNAAWKDGRVEIYEDINISVAVALEKGLITPVLRRADSRDVFHIAAEVRRLADLVRRGKHGADDLADSTFTITNLGMFDVDFFIPIVNPPEAAILAVGKIERKPVVIQEAIAIRSVMRLCLAYDHRVLDGAEAAQFLKAIKNTLQDPASLLPKEAVAEGK